MLNLIALAAIILAVYYWWQSQGVRQRALKVCKSYCTEHDLQLLDDTVALSRLWLKRDPIGRMRAWRLFVFEFTVTGGERYDGRLTMLGTRILRIEVDSMPDRMPAERKTPAVE